MEENGPQAAFKIENKMSHTPLHISRVKLNARNLLNWLNWGDAHRSNKAIMCGKDIYVMDPDHRAC